VSSNSLTIRVHNGIAWSGPHTEERGLTGSGSPAPAGKRYLHPAAPVGKARIRKEAKQARKEKGMPKLKKAARGEFLPDFPSAPWGTFQGLLQKKDFRAEICVVKGGLMQGKNARSLVSWRKVSRNPLWSVSRSHRMHLQLRASTAPCQGKNHTAMHGSVLS